MPEYLRVKSGYLRGDRQVKGGEVLDAADPVVKGMPDDYFEPLEASVERATRRPGEIRVTPGTGPRGTIAKASGKPEKRSRDPRDAKNASKGSETKSSET